MWKVKRKVATVPYETWFASVSRRIEIGNRFIIVAATDFACQIKERYEHVFLEVLKGMTGKDYVIEVKPTSAVDNDIANELLYSSQFEAPRMCLNLPVAETSESNAVKRLRVENEKIRKGNLRMKRK